MSNNDMHEFEVWVPETTDKAILVNYENLEHWLPKSQIEFNEIELQSSEGKENKFITVEVPGWLAYEKGMI